MNLNVVKLSSLDVYRDGGSLSASFLDTEGTHRTLMFVISGKATDDSEGVKIYKTALIKSYIESEYVSLITGITYPKTEVKESPVSWSEASRLLTEMESFMEGFESDYLSVYGLMVSVAGNDRHEIRHK